jgi:pilus assembly protein CpaB
MNRKRILVLMVAASCAVLAVFLARGMMGQNPPAPAAVEALPKTTVSVLVAAKDIAIGERLDPLSVQWRDWPRENLADFMITREARPNALAEIEGARARGAIFLGEPIAERGILYAKNGNLMSALVLKGLRGVAIRVAERTAAGGFILPNDRVDIISTVRVMAERGAAEEKEIVFSRTIITNARVLAVNQSLAPDGDRPNLTDLQTAVLELDPTQAELVARAEAQGEISLALRSLSEANTDPAGEQRPELASLSEIPNSVEIYKAGVRFIVSCEPNCEPALQLVNSPFPLVVRDVGVVDPARKP